MLIEPHSPESQSYLDCLHRRWVRTVTYYMRAQRSFERWRRLARLVQLMAPRQLNVDVQ